MLRAALLDAHVYEEVEADRRSISQAAAVVLLACAAAALGTWLRHALADGPPLVLQRRLVIDVATPLVLWLGVSFFTYMVGVSFFRGPHTQADYPEVLRTTGFAFAPALFDVFAFLPAVGALVVRLADFWVLACGIVAVRQALDFSTLRAVGTYGLAYVLLLLLLTGLLLAIPV
jgi:hypothetical protein